ncbi:hypothetical protein V8C35DRAFT_288748 [Trichoderma chlorosporum]
MAFTSQAGTLLGPLTTTWTMPETCSIYMPPCATCGQGFRAQSCNAISGGRVQDNTACWPPATQGVSSPGWPFEGWGFYSPGIVCPAGYVTACTAVYGQRPQWDTQFTLVSSETAVGCCPSGFTCANINGNTCTQTAISTSISTAFCDGTKLTSAATWIFPEVVTVTQTDTASSVDVETSTVTMVLYAPMFQLNFQSTDLPASTTATRTTLSTSSRQTSSESQQTTSSAADNSTGTNSSAGLSSGAKVGLGVGLGLGIAFLLAFSAFIFYYRRSKRGTPLRSELADTEVPQVTEDPKVKKAPGQVYEMGDYYAPVELPGDNHEGEHQQSAQRYG